MVFGYCCNRQLSPAGSIESFVNAIRKVLKNIEEIAFQRSDDLQSLCLDVELLERKNGGKERVLTLDKISAAR